MVKRLYMIVVLCFSMFIAATCYYDTTEKTAMLYVHNNSQFDVTKLGVSPGSDEGYKEILKPGENCTLRNEWVDGKSVSMMLNFYMNGEEYGSKGWEEALTDPVRFKPPKSISDGETVTVHIYDDHWEWRTVE